MSDITPIGTRGRYPIYQAKVGTLGSSGVLIKRARTFEVGQKVEFVKLSDMNGTAVNATPRWEYGIIWLIEGNRLFINRH